MAKKRSRPSGEDGSPVKRKERIVDPDREVWSKSKKKRMRKILAKQKQNDDEKSVDDAVQTKKASSKKDSKVTQKESKSSQKETESPKLPANPASKLQQAFQARLSGSRFRLLNEELYTRPSQDSFSRFSENPELYHQYHEGFRHQVKAWPVNPVHVLVKKLQKRKHAVVADFGCGDAALAQQLFQIQRNGSCPYKVHSFDLVASSDLVTACDMAHVPLPDASVDAAVFCLSLMGTNLADFVREAHRVLKKEGRVWIAEVRSRFESKGNSDGLKDFVETTLEQLGFTCVAQDRSNQMFLVLELKKNGKEPDAELEYTAKPCIYKRR